MCEERQAWGETAHVSASPALNQGKGAGFLQTKTVFEGRYFHAGNSRYGYSPLCVDGGNQGVFRKTDKFCSIYGNFFLQQSINSRK